MTDDVITQLAAARTNPSIIMVVGVGGAGGNAVNHMWNLGIKGVDFMVCNTDQQALDKSPVELKVRLDHAQPSPVTARHGWRCVACLGSGRVSSGDRRHTVHRRSVASSL